ncbi:hypothetical protein V5799_015540 [Amblyomma americanum]|uniref:Uncharacterized protein n=1 Tax=Amblyomma americanum TaxID=6943 RepID=A0AAQ4F7R0_AMBAM
MASFSRADAAAMLKLKPEWDEVLAGNFPKEVEVPKRDAVFLEAKLPEDVEKPEDIEAVEVAKTRKGVADPPEIVIETPAVVVDTPEGVVETPEDVEVPDTPPAALDQMGASSSSYVGQGGVCVLPCSSWEDRQCYIFSNLAALNGFFRVVGLELQKCVSELVLVPATHGVHRPATVLDRQQAAILLHQLLTKHSCLAGATIHDEMLPDYDKVVCHAISNSVGLKRLSLGLSSPTEEISKAFVEAVASLTRLESIDLTMDTHGHLLANFGPLLAESASLKALRAVDVLAPHPAAKTFLEGLFGNRTIADLSLTTSILNGGNPPFGSGNPHIALGAYLKLSPSLTSVRITAPKHGPEVDVWTICDALTTNKVLKRLELEVRTLKLEYSTAIKWLLYSNKTLRHFSFTCSNTNRDDKGESAGEGAAASPEQECPRCCIIHFDDTDHVKPWAAALLENDTSITELRFSMWGFSIAECTEFWEAATTNKSLRKVTLEDVRGEKSDICLTR